MNTLNANDYINNQQGSYFQVNSAISIKSIFNWSRNTFNSKVNRGNQVINNSTKFLSKNYSKDSEPLNINTQI